MIAARQRYKVVFGAESRAEFDLREEARRGLAAPQKTLPCRFFYDREGSQLFERICELPEYYLTRCEREILAARAAEIVRVIDSPISLVELGSGSAAKTRILIEALLAKQRELRYVPVDIAAAMLEESSQALLERYPSLAVTAIAAEYREGLELLASEVQGPKLVLWLGSNIGNFERQAAADFLAEVAARCAPEDRLLVGIDLRKVKALLEAAYDDSRGVTREFNLNLLARLNREVGAAIDLARFRHVARYDEAKGRIEMYLESRVEQRFELPAIGMTVRFQAGERIHTENSYKYSEEEIAALAARAGLALERQWLDTRRYFSVNLFAPEPRPLRP